MAYLNETGTQHLIEGLSTKCNERYLQAELAGSTTVDPDVITAIVKSVAATESYIKLQTTPVDPGEDSTLAANTLLGVYQ